MTLLGKNAQLYMQVHQERAFEHHNHWFFCPSTVLLFMRGYTEEEAWPDMASGRIWPVAGYGQWPDMASGRIWPVAMYYPGHPSGFSSGIYH
jgi:hypothetical protein